MVAVSCPVVLLHTRVCRCLCKQSVYFLPTTTGRCCALLPLLASPLPPPNLPLPRQVADIVKHMHQKLEGYLVLPYTGDGEMKQRDMVLADFMANEAVVVVATICFGMGINKPNVRWIIQCAAVRLEFLLSHVCGCHGSLLLSTGVYWHFLLTGLAIRATAKPQAQGHSLSHSPRPA